MANHSDILAQVSTALSARAAAARNEVAAIRLSGGRRLTGTVWRPDLIVTSEQSLPKRDTFDVVLGDGATAEAKLAGRDPGTNVAVLRLSPASSTSAATGNAAAAVGTLALAFGADGMGGASVRLGLVNLVGPEWHSRAGGRIGSRIVLDMQLRPSEEGGPAFNAEGGRLGITTFGPRRQILVIPADTIETVLPSLLQDGRVARGWLGVALQPVAVPDALQPLAGQETGLMALSVAKDGPAAKAGLIQGDVVLAVGGNSARSVRGIVPSLGPDSVGKTATLRVLRGGTLVTLEVTIEARPTQ